MFTRYAYHKFTMILLGLMILTLSACAPIPALAETGPEPTQPAGEPTPSGAGSGLDANEILIQLTYEPGFVMPQFRFPFGRTPFFTLLADGRVIYVDELRDSKVMAAQLSPDEAAALLQKVRGLGFERLQSHTDFCGKMADGTQNCVADASTSVLRVRMPDGSLREIQNYANFSNDPAAYEAIYNLLADYTHPQAAIYLPHGATLFVRMAPPPENASPADWPLDPAYVKRAQTAPDQFTAVALNAEEAAKWQKEVGVDNSDVIFQLDGQPVSGFFVPWLPGDDFAKDIEAEFPGK